MDKTTNPIISIIVPIFNVDKYLNKCIDSILGQTFTNYELLLVDDGSTDFCPQICDEYALKDSRIKVIHQNNSGLSSARNAGLDIAAGEYIGFVDSDDWIAFNMYEYLYKMLQQTGVPIAQCNLQATAKELPLSEEPADIHSIHCLPHIKLLKNMERSEDICNLVVWNKLYNRKLFERLRFPTGKLNEDEYVNYKLYFAARHVAVTDAKLYFYRVRNSSIMGSGRSLVRTDKLEALLEREQFYKLLHLLPLYRQTLLYRMEHCIELYSAMLPHKTEYQTELKLVNHYFKKGIAACISNALLCKRTLHILKDFCYCRLCNFLPILNKLKKG